MEGSRISSGPVQHRALGTPNNDAAASTTGTLGNRTVSIERAGDPRVESSRGIVSFIKSLASRFIQWVASSVSRSGFADAGKTASDQVDDYLRDNSRDMKNSKSDYFKQYPLGDGSQLRIATGFETDCGRSPVKSVDAQGAESVVVPYAVEKTDAFKQQAVKSLLKLAKNNEAQATALTACLHQTNMVGVYGKAAFDPSDTSVRTSKGSRLMVQDTKPTHSFKAVHGEDGLIVEVGMLMKSNQLLDTGSMEIRTTAKDQELEWKCKIRIDTDGSMQRVGPVFVRHTLHKL